MKKFKVISDLLSDNKSEYIAYELKESYKDLRKELKSAGNKNKAPIFSFDVEEEKAEINKLLTAFEVVYSYYSTEAINKGKQDGK